MAIAQTPDEEMREAWSFFDVDEDGDQPNMNSVQPACVALCLRCSELIVTTFICCRLH